MGVVVRQSIKGTIVSYVGVFIGYLNLMFITPYCLPPDVIGFSKVFTDAAVLFTFIAQMGLGSALVRFFPYFSSDRSHHGLFGVVIFVPILGFLFLSIITFLFYQPIIQLFELNSPLFAQHFGYVLLLTFFMMYLNLFEVYSSCLYRVVVPKVIREILLRLLNIVIIVLFYFKIIDFKAFVWSIILMYAVSSLLNLYYLSRMVPLSLRINLKQIPPAIRREFLYYTLFVLFVGIGSNIVSKVDVFMISSSINLKMTGIFSIAFYIITIMEIPSRVFMQIVNPLVAKAWKENDRQAIASLYKKSSLNQFLVGGVILLIVWANIDNIFALMPNGHIYQIGKYVVLLLGLAKLFDMVTGVNWYIIVNSKFYYYQIFFVTYLTLVSVTLNALLIPRYGINGAGIASVVALGSYNFLLMLFLKYKINVWPLSYSTLKGALVLAALFLLNAYIPFLAHPLVDGIIRSGILAGLFALAVLRWRVSDDINQVVDNIWGKIQSILRKEQ
ncbi:MAG: polysaccharide biosynthesis C-terminal domain-containing protein [Bacteroidales bacterium]